MNKQAKKLLSLTTAFALSCGIAASLAACGDKDDPSPKTTQLAAPVITLNDNVVSWDAVEHADGYNVTVGTAKAVPTTKTSYTLTVTEAGTYKITVEATSTNPAYTVSKKSNEVTYTVEAVAETLVRIEAAQGATGEPTKTKYYLDENAQALDLAGLNLVAVYSEGTKKPITVTASDVSAVDLTTAGEKEVTVSYTDGEITKTYKFNVTVKERTAADLAADGTTYVSAENEFSAEATRYLVADTEIASARDMRGNAVELIKDGGKTYVAATLFEKSGALLVNADGNFINIVAAKYITDAASFVAINDDLAGYYILQRDISLECFNVNDAETGIGTSWNNGFFGAGNRNSIGKAPLKGTGSETDPTILDIEGNGTTRVGAAFTGTFDGKGHVISDMLVFEDMEAISYWKTEQRYRAMFGYIGQSGVVKNFTLRNSFIRAGQSSAIIAAVNLGLIENITIDDSVKLNVFYGDERGAGYVAEYNDGTIRNVVCFSEDFAHKTPDPNDIYNEVPMDMSLVTATKEGNGTATNCYLGNTSDLTATLGSGWVYLAGYGTVYAPVDVYGKVEGALNALHTAYVGQDVVLDLNAKSTVTAENITVTNWINGGEPVFEVKSYTAGTLTLNFVSGVTLETNKVFKVSIKADGAEIDTAYIKVGAPYVTGITAVATQNITCIQGGTLALDTVDLTVEYSDGTTATVHPTEVRDLDATEAGEKNVVFVYSDGKTEKTINGTVTVEQSQGAVQAQLKSGVDKVILPYDATDKWALKNVDWSNYLEVSVTDFTVTASANSGSQVTLTVSKGALTPATVTVDVYYGIADKVAFRDMSTDRAGWYIITADIAFAEGNGDAWTPLYSEEAPFIGVLDGGYKKITNLNIYSEGWNCGLISCNSGTIKNLVILNSRLYGEAGNNGTVAGQNSGTIENCFVQGTVDGANATGGITYYSAAATSVIKGCVFIGEVKHSGAHAKGGIVGYRPTGWIGNNLFVVPANNGANSATQAIGADEVGDGGVNNAAIPAASLTFGADDATYSDGTDSYTNGLTAEVTALVKEYLQQLSE